MTLYYFDDCTVDKARFELKRAGQLVNVRPKVFLTLVYLLENRHRVVSKNELHEQLWPKRFISDATLNSCLRELRKAINDNGQAQRIIRTVRGQGFRFLSEVGITETPLPHTDETLIQEPDTPLPKLLKDLEYHVLNGSALVGNQQATTRRLGEQAMTFPAVNHRRTTQTPTIERRPLTALHCMVQSATLAQQLDPEDLRAVLRTVLETCRRELSRHNGYIAGCNSDSVSVYFGYPQAHEDDAERAVRAGLDLIKAIQTLPEKLNTIRAHQPHLTIGIASGIVAVNQTITDKRNSQNTAFGQAPVLAARLAGIAKPNSIVLQSAVQQQAGAAFEYQDLGAYRFADLPEPIPIWQALAEPQPAMSRFQLRSHHLTPLVGRDAELSLLLDRWAQAQAGEGQVVLLSGEAGIGKSRLVHTLQTQLLEQPHRWQCYQCSPHHADSALYPFVAALEQAAGLASSDSDADKLEKLAELLTTLEQSTESVTLLASLLSIPAGNRPSAAIMPQQHDDLLQLLLSIILKQAAEHPLVLVFEDIHWIDPSSLELLEQLIDQVPSRRMLLLLSCRPEAAALIQGSSSTTYLTLNRLGRKQMLTMVGTLTQQRSLPAPILEHILGKTDGVPLFVEELTKTVMESVVVEQDDHLTLANSHNTQTIPATLHHSLMSRLDRLGWVKYIAQIGAVIGREFSHKLLAIVADIGENQLQAAVTQLLDSGLVYRRGQAPEAVYIFKHALIQDTAYASLPGAERQRLHAMVALAQHYPQTLPEILAQHYTKADLPDTAIIYWVQAAQRALDTSAHREAISHAEQGLQLLETLPVSQQRDRYETALHDVLDMAYCDSDALVSQPAQSFIQCVQATLQTGGLAVS